MDLGESIKRRRTAANITQAELAESLAVSRPMIAQIERGTKVPNAYLIRDIAKLFGCTVDELLCDTAAE